MMMIDETIPLEPIYDSEPLKMCKGELKNG
jgi:hypothetical protein